MNDEASNQEESELNNAGFAEHKAKKHQNLFTLR
jgi:hypothetical protein